MFAPAPSSRLIKGSLYSIARSLQHAALVGRFGRRAAADREVGAGHDHAAAVDPAEPADGRGGREVDEFLVGVLAVAGEPGDLVEAARVEQRVDPLADGQLAALVLSRDGCDAAHHGGHLASAL